MIDANNLKKSWKNYQLLKKVFDLFGHKNIFFVGGAVRDHLQKKPLSEIDLAVKLDVNTVKKKLNNEAIPFLDLSKGHGTISLISTQNSIEITSMRIDKKTYGRKAEVEFVEDLFLDSCRRDFTVNSIYMNYNGAIYDPHKGINDLFNGRIKFIGSPVKRIQEDKLRILRYFRFLSYYGCSNSNLDKNSANASLKSFSLIKNISKERKSSEFYKLLMGKYAAEVLIFMIKHNVMQYILPSLQNIKKKNIKYFNNLKTEKSLRIAYLLILANFDPVNLREYLHFNKKEYLLIKNICMNFKLFRVHNVKDARLAKYELGQKVGKSIYYLQCFLEMKNMNKKVKNIFDEWNIPELPINGNDLKKIGLTNGNNLGNVLKETKKWWIKKDFKPDRKQCINKSKLIFTSSIKP